MASMSPCWPKIELKKYSTTMDKIIEDASNKKVKIKVGILIQNTISKFSKTKNQTKKRPPKFPKN